jgi:predicted RNA-binding Zn-ribbon protein involved in translation (DUF1610 family)
MSEMLIRKLGNERKIASTACQCQKIGFEGSAILESEGSGTWKCQKVGFEGL